MSTHSPNPSSSPFQPVKGKIIKVIGFVMVVVATIYLWGEHKTMRVDNFVIVMGAIIVGALLIQAGKRYAVPDARELLKTDKRPPILFLRSFGDESRDRKLGKFLKGSLIDQGLTESTAGWGPREQEELARLMFEIGPYIAVGRPGEPLPELGPARLYIPNEKWKDEVGALLGRARFVIVRVGQGDGLGWELNQLAARLRPEQVLFILPASKAEYAQLREGVNRNWPQPLPESRPAGRLLMFTTGWRPVPIKTGRTLNESMEPFLRLNG